jgi:hypothetical protein
MRLSLDIENGGIKNAATSGAHNREHGRMLMAMVGFRFPIATSPNFSQLRMSAKVSCPDLATA